MELHEAAEQGNIEALTNLLATRAEVNARDADGYTPLMHAANYGCVEAVRLLLEAGANVDVLFPEDLTTEDLDCDEDEEDEYDAEDEEEYSISRTALAMACHSEAPELAIFQIVDMLLSAGGDPNFADEVGQSLLMIATKRERLTVVKRLLAAGAEVCAIADDGRTALHYLFGFDGNRNAISQIAHELVGIGADVNCPDRKGRTPLMLAARWGFADVVHQWLKQTADPHRIDNKECNALAYAFQSLAILSRDPTPKYDLDEILSDLVRLNIDPESEMGQRAKRYASPQTEPSTLEMLASGSDSAEEFEANRINGLKWLNETIDILLTYDCSLDSSARFIAKAGRLELLKRIRPEVLNAIDDTGQTALTEAVGNSQVSHVQALLEVGVDVNARNYYGDTPLMCAEPSRRGIECVKLLIRAGADLNAVSENGLTVVEHAIIMQRQKLIPLFLESGYDPKNGIPLLWALAREMPTEVDLLLAHGADPNAILGVDNAHHFPDFLKGTTAFMRAAADQPIEVLKRMLECGANINAEDRDGQMAIGIAMRYGRSEVVNWLRQQGAKDPGVADYNAALLEAVQQGNAESTAEFLGAGADPDFRNENDWTPLMLACSEGHLAIVQRLLESGATVNMYNEYGHGPLSCAVRVGNAQIVKILIQAGVDVNKTTNWGQTALHEACQRGDAEIVKALVSAGSNLNAVHADGKWTPLVFAVKNSHWELANWLIDAGGMQRPQDADYLLQLRFPEAAAQPAFAESIAQVQSLCGVGCKQESTGVTSWLVSPDTNSPSFPSEEYTVWHAQHKERIWRLLDAAYMDCLTRGHLLLDTGRISLLPTDDKFVAITFFNVAGNEDPLETPKIVADLKELDRLHPFQLRGCRSRWLCIEFTSEIKNPEMIIRQLANIHWGFQSGTLAEMVRRLKNSPRITLSWDL